MKFTLGELLDRETAIDFLKNNENVIIHIEERNYTARELMALVKLIEEAEDALQFISNDNYKKYGETRTGTIKIISKIDEAHF